MEKICKYVHKYDFYGLKKKQFFKARLHKSISICLVEGPTPKLWTILLNRLFMLGKLWTLAGILTHTLWSFSISFNCNEFQESSECISGNLFLSCGNTATTLPTLSECLGKKNPNAKLPNPFLICPSFWLLHNEAMKFFVCVIRNKDMNEWWTDWCGDLSYTHNC